MTPATQAQLITACSWCHRVMVNNVATTELDPMTSNVSHGLCLACAARLLQEPEDDTPIDALDYSYRFEPDTLDEMNERCG
jgi:hypothetical protein